MINAKKKGEGDDGNKRQTDFTHDVESKGAKDTWLRKDTHQSGGHLGGLSARGERNVGVFVCIYNANDTYQQESLKREIKQQ